MGVAISSLTVDLTALGAAFISHALALPTANRLAQLTTSLLPSQMQNHLTIASPISPIALIDALAEDLDRTGKNNQTRPWTKKRPAAWSLIGLKYRYMLMNNAIPVSPFSYTWCRHSETHTKWKRIKVTPHTVQASWRVTGWLLVTRADKAADGRRQSNMNICIDDTVSWSF